MKTNKVEMRKNVINNIIQIESTIKKLKNNAHDKAEFPSSKTSWSTKDLSALSTRDLFRLQRGLVEEKHLVKKEK